jgi:hypothetical protein
LASLIKKRNQKLKRIFQYKNCTTSHFLALRI